MKRKIFTLLLLIFIVCIIPFACRADGVEFSVGAALGFSVVHETVNYSDFIASNYNEFLIFTNDKTFISPYPGLSAEMKFLKIPFAKFSLIGRVYYQDLSFSQTVTREPYPALVNTDEGHFTSMSVTMGEDFNPKYEVIMSQLLLNANVFNSGFGVFIGASYGKVINDNFEVKMNIVSPQNLNFSSSSNWQRFGFVTSNGVKSVTVYNSKLPNFKPERWGFVVGCQYEFYWKQFKIIPYFSFDAALNDVLKNDNHYSTQAYEPITNWSFRLFNFGVDIRYYFGDINEKSSKKSIMVENEG